MRSQKLNRNVWVPDGFIYNDVESCSNMFPGRAAVLLQTLSATFDLQDRGNRLLRAMNDIRKYAEDPDINGDPLIKAIALKAATAMNAYGMVDDVRKREDKIIEAAREFVSNPNLPMMHQLQEAVEGYYGEED